VTILAVDAGRSHCRAAVFTVAADGELVRGESVTRASEATAVDPDGRARVAATITRTVAELAAAGDLAAGSPGPILAVSAAGALRRPAAAALAGALAGRWGAVVVAGDVVAAHAGAFGGVPGVVLALGTGAIALAVGADGRHAVVDGAGYLVGDAGGGFAVGRAGLAAAIRHADGRAGGSGALAAAAETRYRRPVAEVPYLLHAAPDPARRVASFAEDVAAVARAGDPVAAAIWRDAVAELAGTVVAAGAAVPDAGGRVALVGPLFTLDDLLTGPLRERLAEHRPATEVRVDPGDALLGAARLAHLPAARYAALTVASR
jgi:N-acetylglucosamine kinase-like BadF-type ATPase